jgi:hypothetical protein
MKLLAADVSSAIRTHLKNDFTVILNEILLSVNLDEVKSRFLDSAVRGIHKAENLVRIGHFQADSSTCQNTSLRMTMKKVFLR